MKSWECKQRFGLVIVNELSVWSRVTNIQSRIRKHQHITTKYGLYSVDIIFLGEKVFEAKLEVT